jgi:hypothetical protein
MGVVNIAEHKDFEKGERLSVSRTLRQARQARLTEVLVIGHGADGALFLAGHPNDPGNALWLMELAKKKLLGA